MWPNCISLFFMSCVTRFVLQRLHWLQLVIVAMGPWSIILQVSGTGLNKTDFDFILWLENEKHPVIVIFDGIFRCSFLEGGSQHNSMVLLDGTTNWISTREQKKNKKQSEICKHLSKSVRCMCTLMARWFDRLRFSSTSILMPSPPICCVGMPHQLRDDRDLQNNSSTNFSVGNFYVWILYLMKKFGHR